MKVILRAHAMHVLTLTTFPLTAILLQHSFLICSRRNILARLASSSSSWTYTPHQCGIGKLSIQYVNIGTMSFLHSI